MSSVALPRRLLVLGFVVLVLALMASLSESSIGGSTDDVIAPQSEQFAANSKAIRNIRKKVDQQFRGDRCAA